MHLHFGTQSLNTYLSIEKPEIKGGRAYCTGATSHLFKILMVKSAERESDSRIHTSCPKSYLERLDEYG